MNIFRGRWKLRWKLDRSVFFFKKCWIYYDYTIMKMLCNGEGKERENELVDGGNYRHFIDLNCWSWRGYSFKVRNSIWRNSEGITEIFCWDCVKWVLGIFRWMSAKVSVLYWTELNWNWISSILINWTCRVINILSGCFETGFWVFSKIRDMLRKLLHLSW